MKLPYAVLLPWLMMAVPSQALVVNIDIHASPEKSSPQPDTGYTWIESGSETSLHATVHLDDEVQYPLHDFGRNDLHTLTPKALCGDRQYTSDVIDKMMDEGADGGKIKGYPHAFNNYEVLPTSCGFKDDLYDYPLSDKGDGRKLDRVVYRKVGANPQFCAVLTHEGQPKNGFVACVLS